MKRRDIVIGLLIIALLGGVIYWRQRTRPKQETVVPETLSSVEEQLEEKFKIEIPEDVDKAELKAVEGKSGSAIATRKFEEGKFTLNIIADLPDPESGQVYQAWIIKDEGDEQETVRAGILGLAKGGWTLQFNSNQDLTSYNKVMLTLEKTADVTPEEKVLEGSF